MTAITITVKERGPYVISVEDAPLVRIVDRSGNEYVPEPGKPIALCRCGHSARKPFCDATHKTCSFDGALVRPTSTA